MRLRKRRGELECKWSEMGIGGSSVLMPYSKEGLPKHIMLLKSSAGSICKRSSAGSESSGRCMPEVDDVLPTRSRVREGGVEPGSTASEVDGDGPRRDMP